MAEGEDGRSGQSGDLGWGSSLSSSAALSTHASVHCQLLHGGHPGICLCHKLKRRLIHARRLRVENYFRFYLSNNILKSESG